ncbi:MAG TPA: acetoacetate--CoA ligase [Myxococcota bacterium]|nr:acetoacetate--CoA ligase [Myxococcota bacterium]HQK50253.1 acetoacetate--CoA ligase [Myxococcota bacterium]
MSDGTVIHQPDPRRAAASQMASFQRLCEDRVGRRFGSWPEFHRWSVECFRDFWRLFLEWADPAVEGDRDPVCEGQDIETAAFFPRLRLNHSWNLLRPGPGQEEETALIARDETGRRVTWTRRRLRKRVAEVAQALRARGVGPGDRVVAIARNDEAAVVASLAATALGAAWSSIGPDQGVDAVLSRFRQLDPKVLFATGHRFYQGQRVDLLPLLREVVPALPTVERVLSLDASDLGSLASGRLEDLGDGAGGEAFDWPRFPFSHPLYVMFSSGTTGVPKCILHGAGGSLLEHLKEHRLHSDMGPGDRLLFTTSAGWMMWNWQVSALASGTTVVAYDGSPTWPTPDALWRVVAEEKVTVFGTSPAFLQFCRESGLEPGRSLDLSALRTIQSTGSVLHGDLYPWVREAVGDLPLHSISGGTDILGCFVLGHPMLPVRQGRSPCVSLAMDVRSLRAPGVPEDGVGELVCGTPFPSRPVGFHGDPDGTRFHAAYFAQNPGFWTHGDFLRLFPDGSAAVLGRSDGVMNIRGVRIGPAEIYAILRDVLEIRQAMALEQQAPEDPGGTRLVLLVQMQPGQVLDRPLTLRIKRELSRRASRVHVPAVVVEVPDLPVTHNGKVSEKAAREAIHGRLPANLQALRNPECLDLLREHPDLGGRFLRASRDAQVEGTHDHRTRQ